MGTGAETRGRTPDGNGGVSGDGNERSSVNGDGAGTRTGTGSETGKGNDNGEIGGGGITLVSTTSGKKHTTRAPGTVIPRAAPSLSTGGGTCK